MLSLDLLLVGGKVPISFFTMSVFSILIASFYILSYLFLVPNSVILLANSDDE